MSMKMRPGTAAFALRAVRDAIERARRPMYRVTIRLRPRARAAVIDGHRLTIPIASRTRSLWNCREGSRHYPEPDAVKVARFPLTQEQAEALRAVLFTAQGGMCGLCGHAMTLDRDSPTHRASFDHVIPRSAGGQERDNLILAHNQCNSNKANDIPTGCELVWLFVVIAKTPQIQSVGSIA